MSGKRSKPQAKRQVNLADYAPGPSDARWNPAKDPATVFRNEDGGSHAPIGDRLVPRVPSREESPSVL
ncbi:hypothetical protein FB107DRAFT_280976 [Schizophyllum commune]